MRYTAKPFYTKTAKFLSIMPMVFLAISCKPQTSAEQNATNNSNGSQPPPLDQSKIGNVQRDTAKDEKRMWELTTLYRTLPPLSQPVKSQIEACQKTKVANQSEILRGLHKINPSIPTDVLANYKIWPKLFVNRVSSMLIFKYMNCDGAPVLLNKQEMFYLLPMQLPREGTSKFTGNQLGYLQNGLKDYVDGLRAKNVSLQSYDEKDARFQALGRIGGGNLGNYWNHYRGNLSVRTVGDRLTVAFKGYVTWSDAYDFNAAKRPIADEINVALARTLMPGSKVDVRSEELAIETELKADGIWTGRYEGQEYANGKQEGYAAPYLGGPMVVMAGYLAAGKLIMVLPAMVPAIPSSAWMIGTLSDAVYMYFKD